MRDDEDNSVAHFLAKTLPNKQLARILPEVEASHQSGTHVLQLSKGSTREAANDEEHGVDNILVQRRCSAVWHPRTRQVLGEQPIAPPVSCSDSSVRVQQECIEPDSRTCLSSDSVQNTFKWSGTLERSTKAHAQCSIETQRCRRGEDSSGQTSSPTGL